MNSDQDFQSIVQHDKYYIPGGDLCFQVDHVSFRVHKYFFERDSSYFAARLNAPTSPGAKPPGSSDATAIVLDEVNHEQFGKLLWVFYNPLYSIYEAPYSTWADILHMAHTWSFHGVKELAIRELENKTLPDVDRIRLYLDNGVDGNLLVPCYAALCEREKPLTLDEGRILGMEVALQIAAGREQVRATIAANGQRSPLTPTVKGKDLHGLIRELFQINDSPASPVFGDNEDPVMNTKPAAGGSKPLSQPPRARANPPPPKLETSTPPADKLKAAETKATVAEPETPSKIQPSKKSKKKAQGPPQTPLKTTNSKPKEEEKRKTTNEGENEANGPATPAPVASAPVTADAPANETVENPPPDSAVSSPPPPPPPKLDASNPTAPLEPSSDAPSGPDSIPSSLLDSHNSSGSTGAFPMESTPHPPVPIPTSLFDSEAKGDHPDTTEPTQNGKNIHKQTRPNHLSDIATFVPPDFQADPPLSAALKGAVDNFWSQFSK